MLMLGQKIAAAMQTHSFEPNQTNTALVCQACGMIVPKAADTSFTVASTRPCPKTKGAIDATANA